MTTKKWTLVAAACAAAMSVIAAPRAARAFRTWKAERRQARIAQAFESVKRGQDYLSFNPVEEDAEEQEDKRIPEQDDPTLRALVNAAEWGYPNPAFSAQKLAVARAEARKWAALMPRLPGRLAGRIDGNTAGGALAPTTGPTWTSLGPTDTAKKEYNGDEYVANDSGRGQTIRVDPTDATGNTVYFAVSGGGIWRTSDFNATTPTWTPLTDSVGDLAIGAMDLYAAAGASQDQVTIWAGLGDFTDAPSGMLLFSRDSGATWSAGIQLTGRYDNGAGSVEPQPASPATRIRDIRIDPNNPDIVLVATDVALYRSTNATSAAPTFALLDLPNSGTILLKESTWSFAFLGAATGGPSQWLVSGVYACAPATGTAAYVNVPPVPSGGAAASATCVNGNLGDIWKSVDGGATWASARAAGLLAPITGAITAGQELGRMALAAGRPVAGDPTQTAVYVQAGNMNEAPGQSRQAATFKTTDSGATYTFLAKNTDLKVTNPTFQHSDCSNMDIAHGQAWYNLAIAVDPANNNNAIQGGNLCAVRTVDGGATWQAVADWLPLPNFGLFGIPQGNTDAGFSVYLPYVHADWHVVTVGANGRVYAGTDGGFFSSDNVFTAATVDSTHMPITWRQVNTGLVTQLHYTIASGDPVLGNHRFAFTGLQDNGTRMRDSGTSTKWNQVVGGDGVAAAISVWDDGSHAVFFHSLPGRRQFCRPGEQFFIAGSFDPAINIDCNTGLLHPNQGPDDLSTEWTTWNRAVNPNLPNGDSEPFLLRIIPVNDGKGSMFTISTQYAWKMVIDDKDVVNYQPISNIFANRTASPAAAVRSPRGMIQVSPWTYTTALQDGAVGSPDRTIKSRLYGVPLSGGWFYIGVENSFDTNNWVQQPWSWTSSQTILGSKGAGGALQQMSSTSSIDFPHDPTHLGGAAPVFPTDLLKTYIVSSVTPADLTNQLIRDDVGRIFKTTDSGTTWTSIAPVSSGMPNIPVNIVRFDPGDATDKTIWAGTDIGVYVTFDGGATWQRYGNGFPMVRVTDMSFARNGSLLRVATFGRGIWEIYPHQRAATVAGNGDWDLNGAIDFIDLAATASRLGKTSADPAQPTYDYNLDTNASDSLDDADLTALLGKYGSTP